MHRPVLIDTARSAYEDVAKYVFDDGNVLEVSYIRKGDGKDILCVPTQTSCNMGCRFCHLTGLDVPAENLDASRIVSVVEKSLELQPPANPTLLVSFMGAGEPLMNPEEVVAAARRIAGWPGYETVRFAVSTILPGRTRFDRFVRLVQESGLNFKLHWSLHSLDALSRKSLMPIASDIVSSLEMVEEWTRTTGLPAEIHYTLMAGVNDRDEDVELFDRKVGRGATVKLLRFAERDSEPYLRGSERTDDFRRALESKGFKVEVYSPPGRDIGSSCGQFVLDQYVS